MSNNLIIHSSGHIIEVEKVAGPNISGIDYETKEPIEVKGGSFSRISEKDVKNHIGNIADIIKGHINEFFNKESQLSEERMSICRNCPLFLETALGPICNPNLYIKGDLVSTHPLEGYKKGCACRLSAKTRLKNDHCPDNKW